MCNTVWGKLYSILLCNHIYTVFTLGRTFNRYFASNNCVIKYIINTTSNRTRKQMHDELHNADSKTNYSTVFHEYIYIRSTPKFIRSMMLLFQVHDYGGGHMDTLHSKEALTSQCAFRSSPPVIICRPAGLCNIGYPSQTHLKLKYREVSSVLNISSDCLVLRNFAQSRAV